MSTQEVRIAHQIAARIPRKFKGRIAAIDPRTHMYAMGDNAREAVERARKKSPKGRFFIARVGYKSLYSFHGGDYRAKTWPQ